MLKPALVLMLLTDEMIDEPLTDSRELTFGTGDKRGQFSPGVTATARALRKKCCACASVGVSEAASPRRLRSRPLLIPSFIDIVLSSCFILLMVYPH